MSEENENADKNEQLPNESEAVQVDPEINKVEEEQEVSDISDVQKTEDDTPPSQELEDSEVPPPEVNPTPQDESTEPKETHADEENIDSELSDNEKTVEDSPPTLEAENSALPANQEELSESIETAEVLKSEPNTEETVTDQNQEEPKKEIVEPSDSDEKSEEPIKESTSDQEVSDGDDKHEDHEELHEEDHEEEIDYTTLAKPALVKAIGDLSRKDDGFKKGKAIFAIKDAYDVLFNAEKEDALKKFVDDGGEEDDFDFKHDEDSVKFEEYFKILKVKRTQNARDLERQKDENLKKKTELLERLREFVDDDENTESISEMKKMQEEWKSIGPVPHAQNRTLWANYNALMDRYYDHRSIYFELKELDRKKNLEAKKALCEQAETLDKLDNLNEAIKKLNELHEEYKHIGPVPREVQEETWIRFKEASDKVYSKRKEYFSQLKEAFQENYDKKTELAQAADELKSFSSDQISEWNAKTKEVLELQKKWETIGSMPKEKAKMINKQFWGGFKTFFRHKSEFFKTLDSQREDNLKLKQALVEKANELKTGEDWNEVAQKMKDLQKDWKNIGPVPEKSREKIFKEFKLACDEFFNRKREHSKGLESEYVDNLKKKEAVCEKLEKLSGSDDLNPEAVYELQDEFNAIGFVPRKAIKSIQKRYQSALNGIVEHAKDFEDDELEELRSLISINKIKSGPHGDQKLHRKEQALKRKIQNLENDISVWKNNMGFFANSKNAEELMADFNKKIEKADKDLAELKEELKLITYAGD